jgi:putative ABC transport system permease protein
MLTTIRDEAHLASKRLLRRPGTVLLMVTTLALGIGPTLASFAVVYGSLLRPLPYGDPDQLVMIWQGVNGTRERRLNVASRIASHWYNNPSREIEVAPLQMWRTNVAAQIDLIDDDGPQRLRGALAASNVFSLLGVRAAVGRVFTTADQDDGLAVISHGFWVRRFGARPDALGKKLELVLGRADRQARLVTIIGVLPERFSFTYPEETDIWVPMPSRGLAEGRDDFALIGRIRPGLNERMIEQLLSAPFVSDPRPPEIWIEPIHDYAVGRVRPLVWLISAVTGVLLLLACINVAGILLTQTTARRDDFGLQVALGASRSIVWRALIIECFLLVTTSLIVAAISVTVFLPALKALLPAFVPRVNEIQLSPIAGMWLGALLTLVIVLAMIPSVLGLSFAVPSQARLQSRSATASRAASWWRQSLIVVQTAVVLVLAVSAFALLQSFWRIQAVDLGFDGQQVVAAHLQLMGRRYARPEARAAFEAQLREQIQLLESVERIGVTSSVPLRNSLDWRRQIKVPQGEALVANEREVDGGYFDVMGIPLRAGRLFNDVDRTTKSSTAILSESLARRLYPAGDAIGRYLPLRVPAEIVGIVGDVRQVRAADEPTLAYYLNSALDPSELISVVVRLREGRSLDDFASAVRRTVRSIDPAQPIDSISAIAQLKSDSIADRRLFAAITVTISVVGLILTVIGLSSVIRRLNADRMKEFGIRSALGARSIDLIAMVTRQAMWPVLVGVGLGLLGAMAAGRAIQPLLFQTSATNSVVLVIAAAAVASICAIASIASAASAGRVDTIGQLRHD